MRRTIACVSKATFLIMLLDCQSVLSAGININYTDRGWYQDNGHHDPNNTNYIVGDARGSSCSPLVYCSYDTHDFFVFTLAGVTQPILSAKLALTESLYASSDLSETFELHDVTTSITTLLAGSTGSPTGIATWNDLGTGVVYGSLAISNDGPGDSTVVEIPLNSAAIAAMNANHGLFAMGGSLTTLDALANDEVVFGQTGISSNEITQLRITYVPEPSTLLLLGIGAISLLGYRKAKSHG